MLLRTTCSSAVRMIAAGSKRSLNCFERGQNLRSQLAHVSCAESQNQVAIADFGSNQAHGGGKLRGIMDGWPLNASDQALGCDAGDGVLAGGVDGKHDDGIRIAKCATELVEEIEGSRVSMRLKDRSEEHTSELQSLRHVVC